MIVVFALFDVPNLFSRSDTDIYLGIVYYENYDDFAYRHNYQPVTGYTNWLEVKAADSRHNCVKVSSSDNYRWVDVDCSVELPFLCEGKHTRAFVILPLIWAYVAHERECA